jgi:preprotein translocase subunit YajC
VNGEEVSGIGAMGGIGFIIYIVFIIGVMYLLFFLPQKRRDKKMREMINSLKVGDKVVTIGGVSGKIVNIKDDEITVETGVEKTKLTLKNWSIKEIDKPIEA